MKHKNVPTKITSDVRKVETSLPDHFKWHAWIVFLFGAFLYANTLTHQFTQDDAIVIYDNMYTTKGIAGLKGLFTKDTFFGFFKEEGKAKLVSGGRYRPMTPAMFAFEYQLVGKHPWLGHLINILMYGFLCFIVYKMLLLLFCYKDKSESNLYLVLAAALIYACHPIHTEAVANIKGRDEIVSMLCSVFALYGIVKYFDDGNIKLIFWACLVFFIGLLSKENTITFLAVIPLSLYFFRDLTLKDAVLRSLPLLVPTIFFLLIRSAVLGNDFGGPPMELMNNPYLKLVNGVYVPFDVNEKMATIIYTLGKYVQLLILPHPLTHDYYPRYIDIMSFGDVSVLLSLGLYLFLIFLIISGFKSKQIIAFGAVYFIITLSIVSNIVFPIGTNMSERFMFMPSLGFAIVVGYLLKKYILDKFGNRAFFILLGIIISMYCLKTITRNFVWESDFSLFTTDVKTSVNSAKVLNAAGGALTTKAFSEKDEVKKQEMCKQALIYLNQAVRIHPTYKNAYLIMGNAYYYIKEYDNAVGAYENSLNIDSDFADARTNLAIALRDGGRQAGEVAQNLQKAEELLRKSIDISPNDSETLRLLGVVNGIKGNHMEAIKYFEKVIQLDPKNASGFLNLSNAYRNSGDPANADKYLQKAIELDPNILKNHAK
ncbi:MAG: tetratricopeptide repeat protein [Saprospiraceae bacterium]|nr:tetratricopeptide repeat protein [Saprospiraceae bacterium]